MVFENLVGIEKGHEGPADGPETTTDDGGGFK